MVEFHFHVYFYDYLFYFKFILIEAWNSIYIIYCKNLKLTGIAAITTNTIIIVVVIVVIIRIGCITVATSRQIQHVGIVIDSS